MEPKLLIFRGERSRRARGRSGETGPYGHVWSHLLVRAKKVVVARRGSPTGVDPCLALCRSAVDLYMCENATTYVPFEADRMAEPPGDITPIPMLSVLPRQLAALYANEEIMMKYYDDRKANAIIMNRRYNKIMGDRNEYLKYLNNPNHWPLWDLQPCSEVEATCTVAAVAKKDGVALISLVCERIFR